MAPLARWGLPDRSRDELLFGGAPPWTARQFAAGDALTALRTRDAGSDTDLNPITDTRAIVLLNPDDSSRAEILRRYRLYSRQPDEMIIFRALQRMKPRELDFDPRLYQYCGGYIYMIGSALAAAHVLGLAHLTSDLDYYLNDPALFGRFYVVARCVSLLFGAAALVALHRIGRRLAGRTAGRAAMLFAAACPVFITAALEAKPHLPAACLILWSIDGALAWSRRPSAALAVRMGVQAGAALGFVLTAAFNAVTPFVLALVHPPTTNRIRQIAVAVIITAIAYLVLNPYVPINFLRKQDALRSNIGNSIAMYSFAHDAASWKAGTVRVARLLLDGAGTGAVLLGACGATLLLVRTPRRASIVAGVGLVTLSVCVAIGAGKPAEFARFLLVPILLLCAACGYLVARAARRSLVLALAIIAAMLFGTRAPAYVNAFMIDADGTHESRFEAGRFLRESLAPNDEVGLLQEPAPYSVPPLDFVRRRVLLLPKMRPDPFDESRLPRFLVFTADDMRPFHDAWWKHSYDPVVGYPDLPPEWTTKITWANKSVFVFQRRW